MKLKNNRGEYLQAVKLEHHGETVYLGTKESATDWPEDRAQELICLLSVFGYIFVGDKK